MRLSRVLCTIALAAVVALPLIAEEPPAMSAEEMAMMEAWQKAGAPGEQHEMLARAAGTWKMEVKSWMDPAAPPAVSEGVSEQEMIFGGRILQQSVKSEMMGMPFEGLGMTGYDNTTGKFWATWVDSMSTGFFLSHGSYDEATNSVTYYGDYPDPMGGDTIKVRAVSREESADKHVFEWYETRGDQELKTMEITYTR